MKNRFKIKPVHLLFVLSFLIWIVSFRGFLSTSLILKNDAVSYYSHTKFFIDSINSGQYPLWDPVRQFGTPNEFYNRRIGSFNPAYLIIALLVKCGLAFMPVYHWFLCLYYFLAMAGFFVLIKRILDDEKIAFVGFLLLMFSSLSTVVFESFIILVMCPMIWFFAFLLSFIKSASRLNLLGMTFTLMVILTTYVPFYFLMILIVFVLLCLLLYFKAVLRFVSNIVVLAKGNKLFVGFCILALLCSLLPGILFYLESSSGEVVMPVRGKQALTESGASSHVLAVGKQSYLDGGIMVTTMISELFFHLKGFQLGQFYIPIMCHVFLLLGIMAKISRRLIFLVLFGLCFYLLGLYQAAPVYPFLYDHVFFFKYLRNFQYYLWFILLPVYILICLDHLKQFLSISQSLDLKRRTYVVVFLAAVHFFFILFLFQRGNVLISSYVTLVASWILLSFSVYSPFGHNSIKWNAVYILGMFILIVMQPVEVYSYLHHNAEKRPEGKFYAYDEPYLTVGLSNDLGQAKKREASLSLFKDSEPEQMWFGVKWIDFARQKFDTMTIYSRGINRLIAYDHVQWVDDGLDDFRPIDHAMMNHHNVAFVSQAKLDEDDQILKTLMRQGQPIAPRAEIITKQTKELENLRFDVNHLFLKTNFPKNKFLVYHDNFHSDWNVFINGKKANLYRANLAFKGIALPAGENLVEFRFGRWWQYWLNPFLLGLFAGTFVYLIMLAKQAGKSDE